MIILKNSDLSGKLPIFNDGDDVISWYEQFHYMIARNTLSDKQIVLLFARCMGPGFPQAIMDGENIKEYIQEASEPGPLSKDAFKNIIKSFFTANNKADLPKVYRRKMRDLKLSDKSVRKHLILWRNFYKFVDPGKRTDQMDIAHREDFIATLPTGMQERVDVFGDNKTLDEIAEMLDMYPAPIISDTVNATKMAELEDAMEVMKKKLEEGEANVNATFLKLQGAGRGRGAKSDSAGGDRGKGSQDHGRGRTRTPANFNPHTVGYFGEYPLPPYVPWGPPQTQNTGQGYPYPYPAPPPPALPPTHNTNFENRNQNGSRGRGRGGSRGRGQDSNTGQGRTQTDSNKGAQCWACGKTGHLSPDCVVTKTGMACRSCGKVGHLAKMCRSSKK
jgi:predicted house-cleaning noncanonical NTP pyrophosphatase (MazG superfamily)